MVVKIDYLCVRELVVAADISYFLEALPNELFN